MKKIDLFPKTILGFYWWLSKKFWIYVSALLILYAINEVLGGILPALTVRWLVDGIETASADTPLIQQMLPVLLLIAGMHLAWLTSDIVSSWMRGHFSPIIKSRVADIIYRRLSRQTIAFFKDNSAGFLVEQAGYIYNKYQKIAIDHVSEIFSLALAIAVNAALLLKVHWAVATLFSVCAGVRLIHCSLHVKDLWTSGKKASKIGAIVTANYVDSISNFMNIKLFSRNDVEARYLNKVRGSHNKARQIASYHERKFWILPFSFENACLIGLTFLLVWLYTVGDLKLGDIAFAFMSFGTMMSLVRRTTWKLPDISGDLADVAQAYKSISQPIMITDAPAAKCLNPKKCRIDFNNISFKYDKDGPFVFKNLNLCIMPGEKVGIVGLSGGGKSTLLYLLMRLYDINAGKISIDGKDIRSVRQDSLRGAISFVPQESVLFNRTLSENISYGAIGAKKDDIVAAAKQAGSHEFIMKMENGYDTPVGDRGIKLSGGQRQRVAIARTICKNAPIVVMDEATSALDSKTETLIQNSMKKFLDGKTALVVAHRLSTLRQMDRIIVLDKGKIVEQGTHAELIKQNGIYANLWNLQVDGFITTKHDA
ncbi:MAG: ABC transporter ATP-binding protein/permease [Rickettsiales bacterium]|jgi:ATP-binding cassette subfamily B protein|nr:ABC transporter ATP-binding protein/permease [Rickettsiales bacterium]